MNLSVTNSMNYYIYRSDKIVLVLFLFISLLVPSITINENLHIGAEEILLPYIYARLLMRIKPTMTYHFSIFTFLFALVSVISILVNLSCNTTSDVFEVYKIIKFAALLIFSVAIFEQQKTHIEGIVKAIFIPLLVLNLAHYFNIFNFNTYIEPLYAKSTIHLNTFGLDSNGNPSVRRMLGTVGNPNINAIIFLLFTAFFLFKLIKVKKRSNYIFLSLAYIGLLMCQSKTAMITSTILIIVSLLTGKSGLKDWFFIALIIGGVFSIVQMFNTYSLHYLTQSSWRPKHNNSIQERFTTWTFLWEMILQKPIIGHGPCKTFFYKNELYSESEYVLYTWRYGFTGLIFYVAWIFYPAIYLFRKLRARPAILGFVIIPVITAITNNPMKAPVVAGLIAIIFGLLLSGYKFEEE